MNEAIFIDLKKSKEFQEINELQRGILDAERTIETEVGKIVIINHEGKNSLSLEIDESLLKTCCKTIVTNATKLEQTYRELKEKLIEKTAFDVYQHYGMEKDKEDLEAGKITGVDFMVGREEDIEKLTKNMAGFGTENSQRVIIDYDKGYGYFVAKRLQMKYGASKETP